MPLDERGTVDERNAGAVLRAAREDAGLSLPHVAQCLKLTVRVLEAIEANDRQRFPPPVYLRGYIKNYARLLGLEAEPLLAAYALEKPLVAPQRIEKPRLSRAGAPGISSHTGRLTKQERSPIAVAGSVAGLMAVVLVAVLVWLWPAEERPDSAVGESASASTEAASGAGESRSIAGTEDAPGVGGTVGSADANAITEQTVSESIAGTAAGRLDTPRSGDVPVAESNGAAAIRGGLPEGAADFSNGGIAPESVSMDAPDAVNGIAGAGAPAGAANASSGDIEPEPVAMNAPDTRNGIVGAGAPGEDVAVAAGAAADLLRVRRLTPIGDEELWFEFTEDCWVEVFDTEGEILYQDLMSRRQSLRLVGAGPFQIRLGYAPGVTLEYNGEAVPLAPHTRNNVALLVVGQ